MTLLIQVLGSRGKCLAAAEAAMLRGCSVVIDRCNFDAEQRGTWVCRMISLSAQFEPFFCLIRDALVPSCFISCYLSCSRLGHNMSASGSSSAAHGCTCRRRHPQCACERLSPTRRPSQVQHSQSQPQISFTNANSPGATKAASKALEHSPLASSCA
jgi:hypothetical protein